jgi:hypothetical protein
MLRSRRTLALCALVASLAWTNVQAMACCWTWSAVSADAEAHVELSEAASSRATASCHGPEAASEADRDDAAAGHHTSQTTPEGASSSSCSDAFTSSAVPACCETFAPAENFSAVPHFEALPPHAFYASEPPAYSALVRAGHDHFKSPDSPRFLALERLLI